MATSPGLAAIAAALQEEVRPLPLASDEAPADGGGHLVRPFARSPDAIASHASGQDGVPPTAASGRSAAATTSGGGSFAPFYRSAVAGRSSGSNVALNSLVAMAASEAASVRSGVRPPAAGLGPDRVANTTLLALGEDGSMNDSMLGDGGAAPPGVDASVIRHNIEAAEARAEAAVASKGGLGLPMPQLGRRASVAAAEVVHHHHHHHHHYHHYKPDGGGGVRAPAAPAAGSIATLAAAAAVAAAPAPHGGSFSPTMDLLSGIRHHASPEGGGSYAAAPHVHSRPSSPSKGAAAVGSPERVGREAAPGPAAATGARVNSGDVATGRGGSGDGGGSGGGGSADGGGGGGAGRAGGVASSVAGTSAGAAAATTTLAPHFTPFASGISLDAGFHHTFTPPPEEPLTHDDAADGHDDDGDSGAPHEEANDAAAATAAPPGGSAIGGGGGGGGGGDKPVVGGSAEPMAVA